MGRLDGKVAIITGAAHGIGRATARIFAAEGARLGLFDIDESANTALATELGGIALALPVDVGDRPAVARGVAAVVERFGGIDVLMNNAAYLRDYHAALDTTYEQWDAAMAVTVGGAFNCCKEALPSMIARGGGSVICVASVGGIVGFEHFSAYCTAKAATIHFAKTVAIDYGRQGIRANAIAPGAIDTRVLRGEYTEPGQEPNLSTPISYSVLGRVGQPEEIAYAALFLASDESSFVTATTLVVDGGWCAR